MLLAQLQAKPSAYPSCTAKQLTAFPFSHAAYGRTLSGVFLRNVSLDTCSIEGFPGVAGYDARGKRARLTVDRVPFLDKDPVAYAVPPSHGVFFALYGRLPRTSHDVADCAEFQQIAVALPGSGGTLRIPFTFGTCGGRISVSQVFPIAEL